MRVLSILLVTMMATAGWSQTSAPVARTLLHSPYHSQLIRTVEEPAGGLRIELCRLAASEDPAAPERIAQARCQALGEHTVDPERLSLLFTFIAAANEPEIARLTRELRLTRFERYLSIPLFAAAWTAGSAALLYLGVNGAPTRPQMVLRGGLALVQSLIGYLAIYMDYQRAQREAALLIELGNSFDDLVLQRFQGQIPADRSYQIMNRMWEAVVRSYRGGLARYAQTFGA